METAFVGPNRTGPGRAGLGHATGRNGPGPKLKFGPAGRAGPGRAVRSTGRAGPGRADKIRPVQISGRRRLKQDMEGAITVSAGKEFQIGMIRLAKEYFLVLCFVNGIESLRG